MNTILQKRIEEAAQNFATTTDGKIMSFAYLAAKQMANFILDNQWISVEEALPEESKLGDSDFVFVKTSIRFPFLACYSYKHETWKDINHVAIHGVTHWTPIPEFKGGE